MTQTAMFWVVVQTCNMNLSVMRPYCASLGCHITRQVTLKQQLHNGLKMAVVQGY